MLPVTGLGWATAELGTRQGRCHWPCASVTQPCWAFCAPRGLGASLGGLCAPQNLGASPWMSSVHPETLGGFCAPRDLSESSQGGCSEVSVHPPRRFLCAPRSWRILLGRFCAPQGLGASPQGFPVHPKVLAQARGRFCAPQDLGAPPGWFLCPSPTLGASPGAPPVTVHFIYGVTYVILSIFLTFPEKR